MARHDYKGDDDRWSNCIAALTEFFAAPIVPAIVLAVSSPGLGGGRGADFVTLAGLSAIGYFYAFFALGLLSLPTFLVLRQRGCDGPVASTVSGAFQELLLRSLWWGKQTIGRRWDGSGKARARS